MKGLPIMCVCPCVCVSECVRYIYAYVCAPMLGLSKEAWAMNLWEDLGAGGSLDYVFHQAL